MLKFIIIAIIIFTVKVINCFKKKKIIIIIATMISCFASIASTCSKLELSTKVLVCTIVINFFITIIVIKSKVFAITA